MLSPVVISLFQAAAGEPAVPPQTAVAESPSTATEHVTVEPLAADPPRRCWWEAPLGSRRQVRVCEDSYNSSDSRRDRERLRDGQNSSGVVRQMDPVPGMGGSGG